MQKTICLTRTKTVLALSTSGSQTEMYYGNDMTKAVLELLCLLLMLNSRILGLIWRGTVYIYILFQHNYFPTWRVATAIEVQVAKRWWPSFWRQIKSFKTQNVQIFLFDMFLPNYKSLLLNMNAFASQKRCPTSMAFWYQTDRHTKSKVQVVVSQGSWRVWLIARDTFFCNPKTYLTWEV